MAGLQRDYCHLWHIMTPLPSSQTFSKHCQAWAEESGSNWIPWNNRKIEFEWLYRADCITMRRRRSILCDILCLISVRWGQWLGLNLELGDNIGSFLEPAAVISFLDIIISSHRKLGLVRVSLVWQDSQDCTRCLNVTLVVTEMPAFVTELTPV